MSGLRERLTYANVASSLALFMALGGGAYAAIDLVGKNDIRSKHIAPNQVKGVDARESSFGIVPNADRLDGRDLTAIAHRIDYVGSNTSSSPSDDPVATIGDLVLSANCRHIDFLNPGFMLKASSTETPSIGVRLDLSYVRVDEVEVGEGAFLTSNQSTLISETGPFDQSGAGTMVYRDPDQTTTIPFRFYLNDDETTSTCYFSGNATTTP